MKLKRSTLRRMILHEMALGGSGEYHAVDPDDADGDGKSNREELEQIAASMPVSRTGYSPKEVGYLLNIMSKYDPRYARSYQFRLDDMPISRDIERPFVAEILYKLEDDGAIDDVDDFQPGFMEHI
jgi:hypothetical protein